MSTTDDNYILGALANGERAFLTIGDRRRHLYIAGQTGAGKTGLLVNLMRADLDAGRGFCFLDPHGDAAQAVASLAPAARLNDVIYLDPSDPTRAFGLNPLSHVAEADRALAAANIVSAFRNIWAASWGPRLEFVLTNALRLLLDTADQTLLGVTRLLAEDDYRLWLARRCRDPVVRYYWLNEFPAYDARQRAEIVSPIQNKIGVLLANPMIRSILCQTASTLDIARVMNAGRVLIVNLSKGGLGAEPAHLLGALLITAFAQAAEARRAMPEDERRDFTLYCDEFQNFATDSFSAILSEARKWRLALVAVNQHISQVPESLRDAVFGNVGSIIAFRTAAKDAPLIAAELGLRNPAALRELDNFVAWARIMRHGAPGDPRVLAMFPPPPFGASLARVLTIARQRHTRERARVEAAIAASLPSAPRARRRRRGDPDALRRAR